MASNTLWQLFEVFLVRRRRVAARGLDSRLRNGQVHVAGGRKTLIGGAAR